MIQSSSCSLGFIQFEGLNYDENFSPVVKPSSIWLVLTMVLSQGQSLKQLDISNPLTQPPSFEDPHHLKYVCWLHKVSLYGLKHASPVCDLKFSNYIYQLGFWRCPYDTSVFFGRNKSEMLILLSYLDDIIFTGNSVSSINTYFSLLQSFGFEGANLFLLHLLLVFISLWMKLLSYIIQLSISKW